MGSGSGKLYIVSTPIGNLKDITFRAIEVLTEVDLIAAEDTRHTRELLNHFNIETKLTSYHEHNKYDKANEIVENIKNGLNVALVSDAGTPIVSDPGNELVKVAIENNIEVIGIPGACAAINALVVSGLSTKSFTFVGFLDDDKKKKSKQLESLKTETKTMIFYVSPHDLKKDLKLIMEAFGEDRLASISREMTKKFEETVRGSLKDIYTYFDSKDIKGEFVLVVEGLSEEEVDLSKRDDWLKLSIAEHMKYYLDEGDDEKTAMKKVAKDRMIDKREVYKEFKSRR